jgi:hypothetical protein
MTGRCHRRLVVIKEGSVEPKGEPTATTPSGEPSCPSKSLRP